MTCLFFCKLFKFNFVFNTILVYFKNASMFSKCASIINSTQNRNLNLKGVNMKGESCIDTEDR